MTTYYTHDNGGRPYKVWVGDNEQTIKVFENLEDSELVLEKECDAIFIGRSPLNPMTSFSGGHGPEFDGNSILVKPKSEEGYIFIGSAVESFVPLASIVDFVSPVGNNDVPYPYAIDSQGRHYLFIENVVLNSCPQDKDPYEFYYESDSILHHHFHGKAIKEFYLGEGRYALTYTSSPSERYSSSTTYFGQARIVYDDGKEEMLTEETYCDVMKDFGTARGLAPLESTFIHIGQ